MPAHDGRSPAAFIPSVCLLCMKWTYERPLCGQMHCVMSQLVIITVSVLGQWRVSFLGPPSVWLPWDFVPIRPERRSAKRCQTDVSERPANPEPL